MAVLGGGGGGGVDCINKNIGHNTTTTTTVSGNQRSGCSDSLTEPTNPLIGCLTEDDYPH